MTPITSLLAEPFLNKERCYLAHLTIFDPNFQNCFAHLRRAQA